MSDFSYWINFVKYLLVDIRNDELFWIALTAIGTIAVAVIAIWKENLHWEPNLVLEAENLTGSNVPLRTSGGQMIASCYYHLRVRNLKPNILTENVRVLFRSIQMTGSNSPVIELHPPRQLIWAPAELGELAPSFRRERTVDLIRVVQNRAEIVLLSAAFSGEHIINWGQNVRIVLEVVADNFSKDRFYELICEWTSARMPIDFSTNPVGHLNLRLRKINVRELSA